MLLGRATPKTPKVCLSRDTRNPRKRVRFVQTMVDSFLKHCTRDVFHTLEVPKKKWHVEKRNVQVGGLVTVVDKNAVRGEWAVGRVTNAYPGADARVRNVTVKTATESTAVQYQRLYSRFITSILKSLIILAFWLALSSMIYSKIAPFFALNRIFFSQPMRMRQ